MQVPLFLPYYRIVNPAHDCYSLFENIPTPFWWVFGIFIILAVVFAFIERFWALWAAYAAMLGVTIFEVGAPSEPTVSYTQCIFWGVATLISCGIIILDDRNYYTLPKTLNAYTAGGALTGGCVGLAISPVVAMIVIGAAVGAFLGAMASRRISHDAYDRADYLQRLAYTTLPQIVIFSTTLISLAPIFFRLL